MWQKTFQRDARLKILRVGRFDHATGSFSQCNSPSLPSLVCDKIAGPWVENHVSAVRMASMTSADCAFDVHACFPPPSSSVSMWSAMADFEFCGDVIFYFSRRSCGVVGKCLETCLDASREKVSRRGRGISRRSRGISRLTRGFSRLFSRFHDYP